MGAKVTKLTRKESKRKKLKTQEPELMPSTSIAYDEFTRQKSFRWTKIFRRKSQQKREKPSQILLEFEKLNRITYGSGEVKSVEVEPDVVVHVEKEQPSKSKSFDHLAVDDGVNFESRKSLGDVVDVEDEDRLMKKSGGLTCLVSVQSDFTLEELPSETSSIENEVMEVNQEVNVSVENEVNLIEDHYNGHKTNLQEINQDELVLIPINEKEVSSDLKLREIEERFAEVKNAVEAFVGKTSDKLYTYLDEMLTSLLVALDALEVTEDVTLNEKRKLLYKEIYACNETLEERAFEEVKDKSDAFMPKTPNNTPIDSQLDDFELMHAIENIHPYTRLVEEDDESCEDNADESVVSSRSIEDKGTKNTTPQNSPYDYSPITSTNVEDLIAATAEKIDELNESRKDLKMEQ